MPHTPGYDDNGSGVSAVLEAAATLARAKCHKNEHSIIFVLFDMEEPGCHGSLEFIRTFLIPQFVERGIQIQGKGFFCLKDRQYVSFSCEKG